METFDSTVIVTAIPRMAQVFEVTPAALSLGLTSFIMALAVMLPASGWLADRFGVRTVFLTAIAGFVVASVLCGLAQTLPQFVAMRALQGAAGAMMSPVGRLVVLRMTEKKDLIRAINFMTFPGLVGPIVAPPVGGFIVTFSDWRWIFFLNIPIGLLGLALVWRFIPDLRGAGRRPFDWLGFVLNGSALASMLFGLEQITHSTSSEGFWIAGALASVGVVMGFLATMHYRRAKQPLVDVSALRIRTFAIATTSGGSFFRMTVAAPVFMLPLFLQIGLGYSAFDAGLLILGHATGDFVSKAFTSPVLRYFGFRKTLIGCSLLFATSIAIFAFVTRTTPLALTLFGLVASGALRSLQGTALSSLQFADVPQEQLTGASTYASVNLQVTRAVGIALAALALNLVTSWHGGNLSAPSVLDFQIVFGGTALVSVITALRYFALPKNAAAHVSAGRH